MNWFGNLFKSSNVKDPSIELIKGVADSSLIVTNIYKEAMHTIESLINQRNAYEVAAMDLYRILQKYGYHTQGCKWFEQNSPNSLTSGECDCGLIESIKKYRLNQE